MKAAPPYPSRARTTHNHEQAIWDRYLTSRDTADRNRLIERYLYLVERVANRMARQLPSTVRTDELVSAGTLGLMAAVEAYSPSRGVTFRTFSQHRIRGAILDELRNRDWVPRSVRTWSRRMRETRERLSQELDGNEPSDRAIAAELDISVSALRKLQREERVPNVNSFDQQITGVPAYVRLGDTIATAFAGPEQQVDEQDLLTHLLGRLAEADRLMIQRYFFAGMTLKKIAELRGISESRACQVLGRIVRDLRRFARVPETSRTAA